ncbi:fibronectin type III domain-containing protein [Kribbella sp. CA-253562]|uniref:RCC1 domain-containing protein n=1 Tax=Kribbella sp. CA-253562 TaxID=3239942 RepID=UPI003D90675C
MMRWGLVAVGCLLATGLHLSEAAAAEPGSAWAWGGNGTGQLGNGTTTGRSNAAPVTSLTNVTKVEAGREHSIALRSDGTVWTWGFNEMGQLGDGTSTNRLAPVQVGGLSGVIDIAGGHYHSLALLADGTVRAWGYNSFGQLGNGATTSAQRTPVVVSPLSGVVAIAGGRDMSYALRSDGTVWGWGLNTTGQVGDATTTMRTRPVRVGSLTGVTAISGGRDHGLAVRSDGTVWAWGDNTQGQVGDGSLTNRLTPVQVTGLTGAVEVAAGAYHSLARLATGTLRAWGQNSNGQLGDGTTTRRTQSVAVAGVTGATAVATGRQHSVAVVTGGALRAWGSNAAGQLGDGTLTDRTSAVTVGGITGAVEVSAGRDHTIAHVPAVVTEPDTTPPSAPGLPTGQSNTSSTITLSWAAATDNASTSLRYQVFEDSATTPVAELTSSGTTVSYTRSGLAAGSTHTYSVRAIDAAGNIGPTAGPSAPITVQQASSAIFESDFSAGFTGWTTNTGLTVDATQGSPSAPSARGNPVAARAFASRALGGTYPSLCHSQQVRISSLGGSVDLFRLRTATDSGVVRVYVDANRVLWIRSDAAGTQRSSGVAVTLNTWHTVELCGTVGTAGSWTLYVDGTQRGTPWLSNTGTAPVGRVQIGSTAASTWTINFDTVRTDQTPN